MLFDPSVMTTPSWKLPRFPSPEASVPMKLPWIRLPSDNPPWSEGALGPASASVTVWTSTPLRFRPITFRAPRLVPPMVLPGALIRAIPSRRLPRLSDPVGSRPIRFPSTRFPVAWGPRIEIPLLALPETTFRATPVVPPMVLPEELRTKTPSWRLAS